MFRHWHVTLTFLYADVHSIKNENKTFQFILHHHVF